MEVLNTIRHSRPPLGYRSRVTLNMPNETDSRALWAILESMGWMKYVEPEPSREDILEECCGAWADDPRTTEEIVAECRSAFNSEIIRDTNKM